MAAAEPGFAGSQAGSGPAPSAGESGVGNRPADAWLDSTPNARSASPARYPSRWLGWRLRVLVLCTLAGCVGVFALARTLATDPWIDAVWRADDAGRIVLAGTAVPALQPHVGRALLALAGDGAAPVRPDALALQRSPRWLIDDDQRLRHRALHEALVAALRSPPVVLSFAADAEEEAAPLPVSVMPAQRGFGGLPALFWLLLAFALALYLMGAVVLLAQPSARSLLYATMAVCQAGNLFFIAIESTLEIGLPRPPFVSLDMPLRTAFDLATAAAMVNVVCLYPRRLPRAGTIAIGAWMLAGGLTLLVVPGVLPGVWWWSQASLTALGLATILLLTWSRRVEPHPVALLLRRFALVMVCSWVLMTAALAATERLPGMPHNLAAIGSMVWYVFFGAMLLLAPFIARSNLVVREFSLLAAVSTFATSLNLVFLSIFALGPFASLALALFISLAGYSLARQWILNQMLGSSLLSTERMFEQLYRVAREVEARPERTPVLLMRLLGELFEPIEMRLIDRPDAAAVVDDEGSTLLVPVPPAAAVGDEAEAPPRSVRLRFAHRGRRVFTSDDARLAERVVEQLRRAVAFDRAVEQGRGEERLRLAQDLHDDIGARLLTLMYKAPSPEMEDYLRHTLKDLKTLTRGLAASNHRLSHAAAEWKADLSQRLLAAQVELKWSTAFDEDIVLNVVQWSALTRVLRELVSNVIAHSQAERLDIEITLLRDRLELGVTDDGGGRTPRDWSHGLGLGGVRKRVKQLGGEVEWHEAAPRGIACRVRIPSLSARH